MQKIYSKYPEISKIKANIVSRRVQDGNTQIILDRTIFMPKTKGFLEDTGKIENLEIISIEEKRDTIIHTVKGKPNKSEVILKLDNQNRLKNLSYNTAFIIFKLVFESFYHAKDLKIHLESDRAVINIIDFFETIDKNLMEEQVNFIIEKALKIENKQGITSIPPLGDLINNEICFDNTAKVRGFKIIEIQSFGNDLEIDFISGRDIVNLPLTKKRLKE